MKILHYTLGFPPTRSGGLVQYVDGIMKEQKKLGHEVVALFPGRWNPFSNTISFKIGEEFKGIPVIELINSLPLPLFGGIRKPADFMKKTDINLYEQLLISINPSVVHIHTLMGIHKEFFIACKNLHIKLVFTSHDYFGLAPEPTFFYGTHSYDENNTIENWIAASTNAYTTLKLRMFQSRIYPVLRNIVRKIKTNKSNSNNMEVDEKSVDDKTIDEYAFLKQYYEEIFFLFDKIHFNSETAKRVYSNNLKNLPKNEVIAITTDTVKDTSIVLQASNHPDRKTKIGYVGPDKYFKGFQEFIEITKSLGNLKYDYHTYGYVPKEKIINLTQHGKFNRAQVKEVYQSMDLIIVPSQWKETFGLIVVEALSFGRPVLVSDNVGSKDCVGLDFTFQNIADIENKISRILKTNQRIKLKTLTEHAQELIDFY